MMCQKNCQDYLAHLRNRTVTVTTTDTPMTSATDSQMNYLIIGLAVLLLIAFFCLLVIAYCKRGKIRNWIKSKTLTTRGPIDQPTDGAGEPMHGVTVDVEHQQAEFHRVHDAD
ncbi:uncharacterized protein LOC135463639 isoform X2 [Liolophura sinensis]